MKRMLLVSALVCLLLGIWLPVHALEATFKGEFYVEGLLNSNEKMLETDHTSAFYQSRTRIKTDFAMTDSLKLTTRFDALERTWGTQRVASSSESEENISLDYAYMTYKSPIGMFQAGRMLGGVWGTSFADEETDVDRIKYVLPIPIAGQKVYVGGAYEKALEMDKGAAGSGKDNDRYLLGVTMETENYNTGLLAVFYNFKTAMDPGQAFATKDFADAYSNDLANNPGNTVYTYLRDYAMGLPDSYDPSLGLPAATGGQQDDPFNIMFTRGPTQSSQVISFTPYFTGTFGNFGINTELDYAFGTMEYDRSPFSGIKNPDRDMRAFCYFFEGTYAVGPLTFQAGFAQFSGDADYENAEASDYGKDEMTSMGFLAGGKEWEKVFILNSNTHGMNMTLGDGVGNHVGDGKASASVGLVDGYKMPYVGVDYAATDRITLGFIAAMSEADDIPDDETDEHYEKDQGTEYNLTLHWKITDSLVYNAIAAFLDGGDYWKYRATGTLNRDIKTNIYALYHQIKLKF